MPHSANSQYLESKVLTASSQKLHLMLIEGAIRQLLLAKAKWDDAEQGPSCADAVMRVLDIIEELIVGVRASEEPAAQKLLELYAFIFKSVAESRLMHDIEKLHDAQRVLEIERETWRQICQKLESEGQNSMEHTNREHGMPASDLSADIVQKSAAAKKETPATALPARISPVTSPATSSFSCEA